MDLVVLTGRAQPLAHDEFVHQLDCGELGAVGADVQGLDTEALPPSEEPDVLERLGSLGMAIGRLRLHLGDEGASSVAAGSLMRARHDHAAMSSPL